GLGYQWRRAGVPMVNGGTVSGANTPTLVINPVACEDADLYDVLISDACGTAQSNVGHIGVQCPSDCYVNCDNSQIPPILNVNDFNCFLNRFAAGDSYANCDGSTLVPRLNVVDFICFMNRYAAGCP